MIYPYRCGSCGKRAEVWQRLPAYTSNPLIPDCCGVGMNRVFTVPMVRPDFQQAFVSPIDGTVISSRAQHREHMLQHNVVLYDDIKDELPAKKAAADAALFDGMKADVNEAITKVVQGYVPERQMALEDDQGRIDVVNVHDLPRELRNEAVVEV